MGLKAVSTRRQGGTPGNLTKIPTWLEFPVSHTDLQAAATSNNITLYSLPAKGIIGGCEIVVTTPFAGTGISTYQLSVGIAGTLEKYHALYESTVAGEDLSDVAGSESESGATAIKIQGVADANLDQSTAGEATIRLLLSKGG